MNFVDLGPVTTFLLVRGDSFNQLKLFLTFTLRIRISKPLVNLRKTRGVAVWPWLLCLLTVLPRQQLGSSGAPEPLLLGSTLSSRRRDVRSLRSRRIYIPKWAARTTETVPILRHSFTRAVTQIFRGSHAVFNLATRSVQAGLHLTRSIRGRRARRGSREPKEP